MQIIIKEVAIEDVVKVNSTIKEFEESGKTYTKEHFQERCKGKNKLITVAFFEGEPAGYMISYDRFGDGSIYCYMAGTDPKFRRNGILKSLMNYLEKWAKKKGYKKIKIKTRNIRREMLIYLVNYGFYFTEVEKRSKIEDNRIFLEKEI